MDYIILMFLLVFKVSAIEDQCLESNAVTCLGLLDSFLISNTTLPLPKPLSADTLEVMCGYAVERFMECSETDFKGCKEELTLRSLTLRNVVGFLCSEEGKMGWTGRLRCATSGRQGAILDTCVSTYEHLSGVMGVLQKQQIYHCRLMEGFINCAETALEELCGRETLLWYHRFLLTVLQSRAERTNCKLADVPMGIVLAILTVVASLGVAVLIVAMYFYNRRLLALRKREFGASSTIESSQPQEVKTEVRRGF